MSVLSSSILVFGALFSFLAGAVVCWVGAGLRSRFVSAEPEAAEGRGPGTSEVDRLRGVSQSLPGIEFQYRVDPDGSGRYRFVGERAETLLGVSPQADDFEEQFLDRVPDAYRDRHNQCVRAARSGERPEQVELPFDRSDGERVWLLLTSVLERRPGAEGEALVFNGFMLDITDEKERDQRLRQTEMLFQNAQDALFLIDVEEKDGGPAFAVQRVNPAYEQKTGFSEGSIRGQTPQDVLGEDAGEAVAERYRTCLRRREPLEYEETVPLNGETTHWTTRIAPVVVNGIVQQIVGTTRDVTERKERQRTLQERREKVETLYETADRLLGASSEDEISAVLVQIIREALGHQGVSVRFARQGVLEVAHVAAGTLAFMPERPPFDVDGDSAVAEVYRSGDTLTISDLEAAEVEVSHDYGDLRSVMVVPIGEYGTLAVSSPEPGAISELDIRLIEVLGTYATAVLDRLDRENSLREERDLLDRLLSTSPAAIVLLDEEGNFARANERAKEVLGIGKNEVTERAFNDPEWGITTVDGRPIPEEDLPFRQVLRDQAPIAGYEHAIEWPGGTRRILSVSGAPLQDVEGEVSGALFHLNDVTERKGQEQALRRRKEKIEALYDATRQLLRAGSQEEVAAEVHGVLQDVFAYPFRHTGFVEGNEIVPKNTTAEGDASLPDPDPHAADGDTVAARALEAGKAVVVPDTGALENDIDYGDLRSAAGVPIGQRGIIIVGTLEAGEFDRLDLRRAKEEAEAARADAEQARDEAQEAARLKSAFLANMSHEIRTPLTSIIGFAEVLGAEVGGLDAPVSGSLEQKAHLIEQGGKRLLDTLEGVLNLSKLEAGQMELDSRPVDLADRARRTAAELRPRALDKGVCLQVESGDQPIQARADDGGVQIVVQNLISNAIKYTKTGGDVWVRTYQEDEMAVLEVEDTGIGMEPETAEELFAPFRQASEGISREYEGSGVGLAVTRRATEEMDGDVEVNTEKGEGSRFVVRLPRAGETTDAEA
ncbi:PAS domain S-box protein [Salinibacter grassmerensis]|uniref:PAS domain S-box protein n=1 Tax=Salinibacter grassmerensis TaxID=3040353 RepID=UPI0021E9A72E|nr:PAS domain S-box protein [Salinibacter grassmerensis]